MLGDSYKEVRRLALNKINYLRGRSVDHHIPIEHIVGGYPFKDAGKDDHMTSCLQKINLDVKTYYTSVYLEQTRPNTTTSCYKFC